ncbi:nucleotidyltransferase family protein [Flammeovirga aprica]|uniref:Nucleotidyltransferase family protein n=1 Tax=Flammeovirga aprica JL-4 TaxID=694437 RepID=A0A7X9RTY8_9BACT|nr:nucleotidyltransferase family protein [Flammeovirga aprica]NME68102.1 nucleotidyltransferase family protein [Flammeovirga aprica JL-4]
MHRAILLLCAGNSSRLGRAKQLLEWNRKSILEHIIEQLQHFQIPLFAVTGGYQKEISPLLQKYNVKEIFCEDWARGMGESIRCGIRSILMETPETEKIMIALSDMPLIPQAHFDGLWERALHSKIVISQFQEVKGVPAVFDRAFFTDLLKLSGDQGAKPVLQKHIKNVSILASEQPFFDVDTEEDYQKLLHSKLEI